MISQAQTAGFKGRISLTAGKAGLDVRVDDGEKADANEYAFYLYRDARKVASRWYGAGTSARFDEMTSPGRYSVTVFRRARGDGQAVRLGSTDLLLGESALAAVAPAKRLTADAFPFPAPVAVDRLEDLAAHWRPGEPQRLDIRVGGFVYPVFRQPAKGDRLYVVFGGAVPDRATITLPRFNRFSWSEDFPGTLLCVADPTLTLNSSLRLGWYVGNAEEDVSAGLAQVIEHLSSLLGVPLDRVVTYGSSGGGFAALQVAARLGRGTTAIAINAQAHVLDYSVRRSVHGFLAACLDGMPGPEARQVHARRLDVIEAWRQPTARSARALLVQNVQDTHHLERHFKPFCAAFDVPQDGNSPDGRIGSMLYSHEDGHAAEPRPMLGRILQHASSLTVPAGPSAAKHGPDLLLHIGLPKTGTTYLQRTFYAALASRAEAPLDYPDAGFYNHQVALYEPLGRHLPWKARPAVPGRWPALRDALGHRRGSVPTLLSAEALSALSNDGVEEFRQRLSDRQVDRIIITVRPLGVLLPSHWQQNMKQGGCGDLAAYAGRMLQVIERGESPSQMFCFRHTVQAWRRVFPDASITVLAMDGSHAQNLLSFARVCGLGQAHDAHLLASVPTAAEQNLSFSVDECRQLLAINERIARGELPASARRRAMDRFFQAREEAGHYERPRLLDRHKEAADAIDRQSAAWLSEQPACTLLRGRDFTEVTLPSVPA